MSKLQRKVSWGLAGAFIAAIGLEIGLRCADPKDLIAYGSADMIEYKAVRQYLDVQGPADVSFLGDSRARESISVPLVKDYCASTLMRPVTVANYACGGARTCHIEEIVRYILKQEHKPKLLLYGMSPRTLIAHDYDLRRSAIYWNIADMLKNSELSMKEKINFLPSVLRQEIDKHYWTFRYRDKPGEVIYNWISLKLLKVGVSCPINGELTIWQKYDNNSLVTRSIKSEQIQSFVERLIVNEQIPMGEELVDNLENIIRLCEEADIPLVFFEVPLSEMLIEHYPSRFYEDYRELVSSISKKWQVPFVMVEDLGVSFSPEDFLEYSHLNLRGAEKFSSALCEGVLIQYLLNNYK